MSSTILQQARTAHQNGDLDVAVARYQQVLQTGEDVASALYGLGTVAMQRQQFSDAIRYLQDATAREPGAADILLSLAQSYFRSGDSARAREAGLRCAYLCRGQTTLSNAVARLLLNVDEPVAAAQQLQRLSTPNATSRLLLSRALGKQSQWGQAVTLLRALVSEQPGNEQLSLELSQAAARLRDFQLAKTAYANYMQLVEPDTDPETDSGAGLHSASRAQRYVRYADLLLMAREVPAASEQLDRASRLGADSAHFYLLRARILFLIGEDAKASSACSAALERDIGLGEAWQLRVETAQKHEVPQLIDMMRRALAQNSDDVFQRELLCLSLIHI